MTHLHRGQKEAIAAFLKISARLEKDGLPGPWHGPELDNLFSQILKASPWNALIGHGELLQIVFSRLSKHVERLPNEYVGLIKDAPNGIEVLSNVDQEVTEYLESLPRAYHVYIPFSALPLFLEPVTELSASIAVVDTGVTEGHDSRLFESTNGLLAAAFGSSKIGLKKNWRYLRFATNGYADKSSLSSAAATAVSQLKHFLFAGLSSSCFREAPSWALTRRYPFYEQVTAIIRNADPAVEEAYALELPDEFFQYSQKIQVVMGNLQVFDTTCGATLLGGEWRPALSPREIADSLRSKLQALTALVSVPLENKDATRIKAAIEWWIDGSATKSQTISFLQLCIGIEALLGEDGGDKGLTEKLADRYAYLMGGTNSARQRLRNQFRDVYRRRGEIVHQREIHLRRDDLAASDLAKSMLGEAIQREIRGFMRIWKTGTKPL